MRRGHKLEPDVSGSSVKPGDLHFAVQPQKILHPIIAKLQKLKGSEV
jgi:hypothetical protein